MTRKDLSNPQENPENDENALWSIISYLLAGLLIWGGIGWGFDQWLGTNYGVFIGLLLGAGASVYLVWLRFGRD